MKKLIYVQDFENKEHPEVKDALVVAFKKKNILYMQNLELPKDSSVHLNSYTDEIVIKIKLKDNQFMAIGSSKDMVEQKIIKD